MSTVLVVEHLISLRHATKIMKTLKQRKHAKLGYFFELTDLGVNIWHQSLPQRFPHLFDHDRVCKSMYADYGGTTAGYHLKVYRTLEA